jgi:superfamily I DNA/RNA helicase
MEEQRRLFYVAITRTSSILVLSSITRLPRDMAYRMRVRVTGGNRTVAQTIASRFLRELGPERPMAVSGYEILEG